MRLAPRGRPKVAPTTGTVDAVGAIHESPAARADDIRPYERYAPFCHSEERSDVGISCTVPAVKIATSAALSGLLAMTIGFAAGAARAANGRPYHRYE